VNDEETVAKAQSLDDIGCEGRVELRGERVGRSSNGGERLEVLLELLLELKARVGIRQILKVSLQTMHKSVCSVEITGLGKTRSAK
jgi:hypothetical protein